MQKIWVIKIGSNILTSGGVKINSVLINNLARQINELKQNNIDVLLVSSGAIAAGLGVINLDKKPQDIHKLQALASIGQMDLMHSYENAFSDFNIITSQILLTNDNLINKERYDNILGTITNLLNWGVVPIINENDTISTDEIKFGDNDNLAALLSNVINADKLIILTDQKGLFDKNPDTNSDAKLITKIKKNDKNLEYYATDDSGSVGTGGMKSKIMATKIAKCTTYITSGILEDSITDILRNNTSGTIVEV